MTNKISGIYESSDGFIHTIFYVKDIHEWIDSLRNKQGCYCSHSHFYPDEIKIHIANMKKIEDLKIRPAM